MGSWYGMGGWYGGLGGYYGMGSYYGMSRWYGGLGSYYGMGGYYGGLGGWYGGLGGYGWYGGGVAGWWNPWWYGAYHWLADPAEPALDPGFWNLRGAVDKVLAAGSPYAGGYDSHPFELLDTAWLPIVPAELPNADASSSATPSAPNEPGASLSGLAFGVLNAALGSGIALTVATAALGDASEAPAESSTRVWNQDEVLHRLGLIDEDVHRFWDRYGSIAPAGWTSWLWFWRHQGPFVPILPENSNGNIDLGAIKPAWSSAPSIYTIQVPNDWDSEKVASYILQLVTDARHPSRWSTAYGEYLYNIKREGDAFAKWLRTVRMQILSKAGQNAELYLKLAVGALPGGSGALALNALSKGDYAEAALEVFFLIPWLRFAGARLNHIRIVARNGDEVIVARRAVKAWQDAVYNGGKAGLKRAEDLGQALKAGGRNADEVVDALEKAGFSSIFRENANWRIPANSMLRRAWNAEYRELRRAFDGTVKWLDQVPPPPHPRTGRPSHGSYDPPTNVITLYKGADEITFFHELLYWKDHQMRMRNMSQQHFDNLWKNASWRDFYIKRGEATVSRWMIQWGFEWIR